MNIGKLKAIMDREYNYVAKVNPVLIGYLFINEAGWSWWYLLAVPVFIVLVYIDLKYIMPQEFEYLHGKSPILKRILEK